MTEDEMGFLEAMIAAKEDHGHMISEWERKFLDDQRDRYAKYAAETRMSPKQWAVLAKIAEKLSVER